MQGDGAPLRWRLGDGRSKESNGGWERRRGENRTDCRHNRIGECDGGSDHRDGSGLMAVALSGLTTEMSFRGKPRGLRMTIRMFGGCGRGMLAEPCVRYTGIRHQSRCRIGRVDGECGQQNAQQECSKRLYVYHVPIRLRDLGRSFKGNSFS